MIPKLILVSLLFIGQASTITPSPATVKDGSDILVGAREIAGESGTKGMQYVMFVAIGALASVILYQERSRVNRDKAREEQRDTDIKGVRDHYEKEITRLSGERERERELLVQQSKITLQHHDQFVNTVNNERAAINEERGKMRDKLSEIIKEDIEAKKTMAATLEGLKEVVKDRIPITPVRQHQT